MYLMSDCIEGKKFPSNTIVGVDRSSADEKRVRIKVSEDFDESELTICCEVKVLRDSGYGSTKTMMKEKCSTFDVMEGKDGDSFCFPDLNLPRTCHACGT